MKQAEFFVATHRRGSHQTLKKCWPRTTTTLNCITWARVRSLERIVGEMQRSLFLLRHPRELHAS